MQVYIFFRMKITLKKYSFSHLSLLIAAFYFIFAAGCKEDDGDTTPPGKISNPIVEALNGGAKID